MLKSGVINSETIIGCDIIDDVLAAVFLSFVIGFLLVFVQLLNKYTCESVWVQVQEIELIVVQQVSFQLPKLALVACLILANSHFVHIDDLVSIHLIIG